MSPRRMTSKACSRPPRAAPNPSAVSASPSRCSPRVSSASAASVRAAASRGSLKAVRAPRRTAAATMPSPSPTRGANAIARPATRRSIVDGGRTGSAVRVPTDRRKASAQLPPAVGTVRRLPGRWPGDRGLLEGGHLGEGGLGRAEDRQGDECAGALTEPEPEVHDGDEAEPIEGGGLRRLGRPVPRDPPLAAAVRDAGCHEGGGARHDPVEQDRSTPRGGLHQEARSWQRCPHPRTRRAASIMSWVTARPRRAESRTAAHLTIQVASSIPVPRPTTDATSLPVRTAVSAAAAVVLPIPMSPGMSRSTPASISWSAMARPASKAWAASSLLSAGPTLRSSEERRTLNAVTSSGSSAPSVGPVDVDGEVEHPDGRRVRPGERVDGGPTAHEVEDHLGRHLGWIGADSAARDPVVGREHHHGHPVERARGARVLHAAQPDRQLLEPAERAGRLGQARPVVPRGRTGLRATATRRSRRCASRSTTVLTARSLQRQRMPGDEEGHLVDDRTRPWC